jgi:hypothetical protein
MVRSTVSLLSLIPVLLAAKGVPLRPADPGASKPGVGGDAVLPAGAQEIRWGATSSVVELTRGMMEKQPQSDPHVRRLIEVPGPEERGDVIHWRFWDDQLFELQLYYQDALVGSAAHEFVERVERAYGAARHEAIRGGNDGKGGTVVVEERWAWEDPFTLQVLIRDARTNSWSMLRRSRVLDALRDRQLEVEREQHRESQVNSIPID